MYFGQKTIDKMLTSIHLIYIYIITIYTDQRAGRNWPLNLWKYDLSKETMTRIEPPVLVHLLLSRETVMIGQLGVR